MDQPIENLAKKPLLRYESLIVLYTISWLKRELREEIQGLIVHESCAVDNLKNIYSNCTMSIYSWNSLFHKTNFEYNTKQTFASDQSVFKFSRVLIVRPYIRMCSRLRYYQICQISNSKVCFRKETVQKVYRHGTVGIYMFFKSSTAHELSNLEFLLIAFFYQENLCGTIRLRYKIL